MSRRLYQFVDKNSGGRSKPFINTDKSLAEEIVRRAKSQAELESFYILLIANLKDGADDIEEFAQSPLVLASTFVSLFYPIFFNQLPVTEENGNG